MITQSEIEGLLHSNGYVVENGKNVVDTARMVKRLFHETN